MDLTPIQLSTEQQDLVIEWSDATVQRIAIKDLRDKCPCATCREKRSQDPPQETALPLLALEATRPVSILKMEPTGNYAYSIHFSDGHSNGIFTIEYLRSL